MYTPYKKMRFLSHILVILALGTAVPVTFASGEALIRANHNAVIQIEAGWFVMGSSADDLKVALSLCTASPECALEKFADERPAHRVYLSRYRIDRTEVSRKVYRRCVLANICRPSRITDNDSNLGRLDYPVSGINWAEARRYCNWVGGDLPTEAQWERAARGRGTRIFPWGQTFRGELANHGSEQGGMDSGDGYLYAAPVEAFESGKSISGLINMSGNVWEFTRDYYSAVQYRSSQTVNPVGPLKGDQRVIRGGSWQSPVYTLRTSGRGRVSENESLPDIGFRCAYDTP